MKLTGRQRRKNGPPSLERFCHRRGVFLGPLSQNGFDDNARQAWERASQHDDVSHVLACDLCRHAESTAVSTRHSVVRGGFQCNFDTGTGTCGAVFPNRVHGFPLAASLQRRKVSCNVCQIRGARLGGKGGVGRYVAGVTQTSLLPRRLRPSQRCGDIPVHLAASRGRRSQFGQADCM